MPWHTQAVKKARKVPAKVEPGSLDQPLAQEESRSISENVTWGQRKRFADGKIAMPYKSFLGYRKGVDGRPEIVPEEAKIVRRIYREFLLGMTFNGIAKGLEADGIKSPRGKDTWRITTIKSILQNEKYKGDALLQKRFTVDFLTKKQKRIICDCCGEAFTRKVWHSTSKYRRYIWQCGKKYEGGKPCSTPHFSEEEIISAFESMMAELLPSRQDIIGLCQNAVMSVLDT